MFPKLGWKVFALCPATNLPWGMSIELAIICLDQGGGKEAVKEVNKKKKKEVNRD